MKKVELVIRGKKVVYEDYRTFLLEKALILGIKGFSACNYLHGSKELIIVKLEGSESQIEEFVRDIRSKFPERAELEEIEERCIDGYVMSAANFMKCMQEELWYRFAAALSGNEIGSEHLVAVRNDSVKLLKRKVSLDEVVSEISAHVVDDRDATEIVREMRDRS